MTLPNLSLEETMQCLCRINRLAGDAGGHAIFGNVIHVGAWGAGRGGHGGHTRGRESGYGPGWCRSLRLRLYGFEFVGMAHFWLVDCVDCVERCYIQTFPFLFPSFMALAPFALLPSVTAIAC